ncbi:MAG: hypothetical protein M3014_01625 [Chloroflexota bacterium]|nr:hypothetical protein [Chloroflexota bacterium]
MPVRHSPFATAAEPAAERPGEKATRPLHSTLDFLSPAENNPPTLQTTPLLTGSIDRPESAPVSPLPQYTSGTSPVPSNSPDLGAVPNNETANEEPSKPGIIRVAGIDFHHESEAEFARLLNYYGIEWQYEPQQFPLQWRDERPIEMFAPDFYLVEYDLFIELTTMRQALVRRKNRKLRLLRALYPEINIKLLYRRDYQRLLDRFGIRADIMDLERPTE